MVRAWLSLIWSSLAVAVVAAAAQLGVADALGIIRWKDASPASWSVLLTWVAFSYAVAVLSGASIGRRAVRRPGRPDGGLARAVAAIVAGLGGAAAVGLVWLLAQSGAPRGTAFPDLVVATTAGAGVVVGTVLAMVAAGVPAVAVGLRATAGWVWFVGVGCAGAGYLTHQPFAAPRLAVVDAPSLVAVSWWSGPNLMIAAAAILGAAVAAVARWAGNGRLTVACAGFAGPVVVAASYLVAWPGMGSAHPALLEPYRASSIAVGAGLLASILVTLLPRRRPDRAVAKAAEPSGQRTPEPDTEQDGARESRSSRETRSTRETRGARESRSSRETRNGRVTRIEPAMATESWSTPSQAQLPDPGLMGQPRHSFEEDYSDWLRELGHVPGQPGPRADD